MNDFLAGYRRFRTAWPERQPVFEALAETGQKPTALVIACVDSRVDPALIFDAAPGEMLTVRNVANIVPPYALDNAYHGTSAALEFGVRVLEVPHVIVLGHEQCGGVKALLDGPSQQAGDFVTPWMSIAATARVTALGCSSPAKQQVCCEQEVIKISLANLMSFPWIAERCAAGRLTLHGLWFSLHTGELAALQPDGSFAPLDIPA